MGYIYLIRNTVNGKSYIGKTAKTIERRFAQHVKSAVFTSIFRRHTWPPWEKTETFHQLIQARVARHGSNSFEVHVDNIGRHSGFSLSNVGAIGLEAVIDQTQTEGKPRTQPP